MYYLTSWGKGLRGNCDLGDIHDNQGDCGAVILFIGLSTMGDWKDIEHFLNFPDHVDDAAAPHPATIFLPFIKTGVRKT
jgi:hypothetical protein